VKDEREDERHAQGAIRRRRGTLVEIHPGDYRQSPARNKAVELHACEARRTVRTGGSDQPSMARRSHSALRADR
jgi:hypothetical protein